MYKRLAHHTDVAKRNWFFNAVTIGVKIGLSEHFPARVRDNNPKFSYSELAGIGTSLLKWRQRKWILGPFTMEEAHEMNGTLHLLFGVPKPDGRTRPILHMSDKSVLGYSVNDRLDSRWCTVEYIQQKECIETLLAAGKGCLAWAKDIEWGFNNVSVRKEDFPKLGFCFDGKVYFYQVLPMGASTSPRLFTEFMAFPLWAIKQDRPDLYYEDVEDRPDGLKPEHFRNDSDLTFNTETNKWSVPLIERYVDDVLGCHGEDHKAADQWTHSENILEELSLPTKKGKGRPPNNIQIWLGKEYDTTKQEVKLPDEKVERYLRFIADIANKNWIEAYVLLSAIGKARHMGTIYRPLNAFARGLETYVYRGRPGDQHRMVHMSKALIRDLEFLTWAIKEANQYGVPFSYFVRDLSDPDITLHTDASLTIGIGAVSSNGYFIQQKWSDIFLHRPEKKDILWKEMCAIFVMLHALDIEMGDSFKGLVIHVFTDNMPCKWMLMSMRSRLYRPDLQILINAICELCIKRQLQLWMDHIPGKENIVADALSRYFPDPLLMEQGQHKESCFLDSTRVLQLASDLSKQANVKNKFLRMHDDDENPNIVIKE